MPRRLLVLRPQRKRSSVGDLCAARLSDGRLDVKRRLRVVGEEVSSGLLWMRRA